MRRLLVVAALLLVVSPQIARAQAACDLTAVVSSLGNSPRSALAILLDPKAGAVDVTAARGVLDTMLASCDPQKPFKAPVGDIFQREYEDYRPDLQEAADDALSVTTPFISSVLGAGG